MKSKTTPNHKSTTKSTSSSKKDSNQRSTAFQPYKQLPKQVNKPIDASLQSTTIDKRINEYSVKNPQTYSDSEIDESEKESDKKYHITEVIKAADTLDMNDHFTKRFCHSITTTTLDIAIASMKNIPTTFQPTNPLLSLDSTLKLIVYPQLTVDSSIINDNEDFKLKDFTSIEDLTIKQRLISPFNQANSHVTDIQKQILPLLNTYRDMLYHTQSHQNTKEIRMAYCLHALNHCYKTRDRILKNTLKIKQDTLAMKECQEVRDQGFTRPVFINLYISYSQSYHINTYHHDYHIIQTSESLLH